MPRQRRVWKPALQWISIILTLFLLGGCLPQQTAFSPEQAAINAAAGAFQDGVIQPETVQPRQKLEQAGRTFVMVSFMRLINERQESCLMMYETEPLRFGLWVARGGGGGCYGLAAQAGFEAQNGMEVGGGHNGGTKPDDPGFSHVKGLVYDEDIQQVQVTWEDDQQQLVPVINDSYLTLRAGQFTWKTVEGLDADGEVVFNAVSHSEAAPGKQIEP